MANRLKISHAYYIAMKRNNGKCFTKGICLVLFIALFTQANAQELHYPIPCPPTLKIPAGENISCGYFGVPERHKNPDGRQIQFFYDCQKPNGAR